MKPAKSDRHPSAEEQREALRRLSVDLPFSLHKATKARCVDEERDIRDVVIVKLTGYVNNTDITLSPELAAAVRKKLAASQQHLNMEQLVEKLLSNYIDNREAE